MAAVPDLRDNTDMRKHYASDRAQGFSLRGTFVLGLLVVPLTCALTFFGLTVSTQAMFGAQQADFSEVFGALLYQQGWLPTPAPSPTEPPLSPTAFNSGAAPAAADSGIQPATLTPSATASLTATASQSPTATATATNTSTPTASHTSTATATATPTPSATSTLTPTASRTPSPSPSPFPTNTPEPSLTPTPAPPTDTPQPSNTPTPGPSPTPVSSTCDATINTAFEDEVVSLVNQERQSRGLASYSVDSRLRGAARAHATDMACNHFTGHTGSDGSNVGQRATAHGYSWSWIGENYYVTSDTINGPQVAFDWWMNSTPHRDNLLSPNYTDFGVGYIYSAESDYGGYFVIVFGRPQ